MAATSRPQRRDSSLSLDLGVEPLEHTIELSIWDGVIGFGAGLAGGAAAYYVGTLIAAAT